MSTDLLRGHLDRLLLAVLAGEPGHGYALSRRLRERSGGELEVNEGSLYPALHRLERDGLVDSSWRKDGGRRRRVYRLTARGKTAAGESRREWRSFVATVEKVLA